MHPTVLEASPTARNPEALYKTLLTRQEATKSGGMSPPDFEWTAQGIIPTDYKVRPICDDVAFKNTVIEDPMIERPFKLVATHFKDVAKPSFKITFNRPSVEEGVCNAPGIKAALKIKGGGMCRVTTNSGNFGMRPLWRKVDEDGKVMELFE